MQICVFRFKPPASSPLHRANVPLGNDDVVEPDSADVAGRSPGDVKVRPDVVDGQFFGAAPAKLSISLNFRARHRKKQVGDHTFFYVAYTYARFVNITIYRLFKKTKQKTEAIILLYFSNK